jgi:hypothetical protein
VYAAGKFTLVPGYARNGVVAWDPDTGGVLPFDPGTPADGFTDGFAFFRDRVLLVGQRARQPGSRNAFEWVDRISGRGTAPASDVATYASDASRTGDTIYAVGSRTSRTSSSVLVLARIDAASGATHLVDVGEGSAGRVAASDDYVVIANGALGTPAQNLVVFRGPQASSPRQLTAAVTNARVTLRWRPGTPPAASFVVEAGTSAGATDIGTFAVGGATQASGDLAVGTYFLRVRPVYPGGAGSASSEVIVTVPSTSTPPNAPGPLSASVASGVVTLSWGAASGNATTYVIEAGTASGLTNIGTLPTGALDTTFSTPAPAGTCFVRIRAANAIGQSPPSNEVIVAVPDPDRRIRPHTPGAGV